MTRIGDKALDCIGPNGDFVPALHTIGAPLTNPKQEDSPWPCSKDTKIITHFPETRQIMVSNYKIVTRDWIERYFHRTLLISFFLLSSFFLYFSHTEAVTAVMLY